MYNSHTEYMSVRSMRAGWTLIELIFIIILIGILASIAIGKLSTTRDDAKLSADVANMNICLRDMKNIYTATHTDLEDINSSACDKVVCYAIEITDTTLNVELNSTAAVFCADVENVGGHLAHEYELGAAKVKR